MNYTKENPDSIMALFDTIAPRYDLANSIMSFHTHALWNRTLARKVIASKPQRIIDLCAGTGEIAFRLLQEAKRYQLQPAIELVDFSEKMLYLAQMAALKRSSQERSQLSFSQGNVEELWHEEASFQAATCAYGIRNVQHPERCFASVLRILQPKGHFYILELTCPPGRFLKLMHRLYMCTMLPSVGKWLIKNKEAYSYLQKSIETSILPEQFAATALKCGFSTSHIERLFGGIATIITLEK